MYKRQIFYHPNGAIFIRKAKDLSDPDLKTIYAGAIPYIMSKESSVDIDDEHDFNLVESILLKRGGN